jgi:hypothetical protein
MYIGCIALKFRRGEGGGGEGGWGGDRKQLLAPVSRRVPTTEFFYVLRKFVMKSESLMSEFLETLKFLYMYLLI